jgi:hypothetical protein
MPAATSPRAEWIVVAVILAVAGCGEAVLGAVDATETGEALPDLMTAGEGAAISRASIDGAAGPP